MELEFRPGAVNEGDGAVLVAAMALEISTIYDGLDIDAPDMPKAGPAELGPPHGAFIVGYADGDAVCCGGLKRLPDGAAEIKRMYVTPAARSKGVAAQLLTALEDAARGLGYTVIRLDTGDRQPHAEALYRRSGYAPGPNFNANPMAAFFGTKHL